MKTKKKTSEVSHEDVQKAVQKFLKDGGIIVQLPEQDSRAYQMVGGEKHQNFESLANLVSR